MASDDDAALLEAWRGGDSLAGRELFVRHGPAVQRFFRSKLGPEREDLIQRTFVACLESRDRLRDGRSFRAYLLTIARHVLYDHLERAHGAAARFDPMSSTIAGRGPSPSVELVRDERMRGLLVAMQRLPIELQLVLELHYWEELDTAAIAEVLGIPRGTVKTRLMRARDRLRLELAAAASDDELAGLARGLGQRLGDDS